MIKVFKVQTPQLLCLCTTIRSKLILLKMLIVKQEF